MDSSSLPTSYPHPISIAVIGGTGLETLPGFTPRANLQITTPWGAPTSPITILEHPSPSNPSHVIPIAFLARHGLHHEFNPTEVPARANIAALRKIGVRVIVAFSAAGSLREEVKPRDFVVPDQVIDRTKARENTFFEGGFVLHMPFADPYDAKVRDVVLKCGHALEGDGIALHDNGTVICMEGPAFSTRAESNMYRTWGGTVINMSTLPEAKLAAEAEIAYANILMSTDYDCWHDSGDVTVEMVMGHMKANAENAKRFIGAVLDELSKEEYDDLRKGKHLEGGRKFGISTKSEGRGKEAMEKMEWLFPGYFT
jgi:5'-methylthioadenosine phosphorylase